MTIKDNPIDTTVDYECDQWLGRKKRRCGKKPYCEVYVTTKHSWSYLCKWHYTLDRIWCIIVRNKSHGYYILDPDVTEDKYPD